MVGGGAFVSAACCVPLQSRLCHTTSACRVALQLTPLLASMPTHVFFLHSRQVARGDLGAELPVEEVPYWQSKIVQGCRRRGKPVIVATNSKVACLLSLRLAAAQTAACTRCWPTAQPALLAHLTTSAGSPPTRSCPSAVLESMIEHPTPTRRGLPGHAPAGAAGPAACVLQFPAHHTRPPCGPPPSILPCSHPPLPHACPHPCLQPACLQG